MARTVKDLPADRSEWTFGDLVYWHVLKYGTRPTGNPEASAGRPWQIRDLCQLVGITERTFRYWINDQTLPENINALSGELFGENPAWDEQRLELQSALQAGWAKRAKATAPTASEPKPDPVPEDTPEPFASEEVTAASSDEQMDQEPPSENEPGPESNKTAPSFLPTTIRQPPRQQPSRRAVPVLVAGVVALFGAYVWSQSGRDAEKKVAVTNTQLPEQKPSALATTPVVAVTPVQSPTPEIVPVRQTPISQPIPAPTIAPSIPLPTQAELEAEAVRKRVQQERVVAFEKAEQEKKLAAIRLDQTNGDRESIQRNRTNDARQAAALGFSLREENSATGPSLGNMLTANVTECAEFCDSRKCDGFSFYRDQYGPGSTRKAYCYLFSTPFTPYADQGHVLGTRVAGASPAAQMEPAAPVRLAQAGPGITNAGGDDGVLTCSTGPVKVTGFQMKCDSILSGGTTLGSTQLSYTVRNINECAAKCRPVKNCVGFTFNGADPEGRHACMLFGPTPEGRDSSGWIAGTR